MAFSVVSKKSGKTYFLHHRLQKLRGGQEVTLYYFGGEAKEGALDALPAGYEVSENERTGLPFSRRRSKDFLPEDTGDGACSVTRFSF